MFQYPGFTILKPSVVLKLGFSSGIGDAVDSDGTTGSITTSLADDFGTTSSADEADLLGGFGDGDIVTRAVPATANGCATFSSDGFHRASHDGNHVTMLLSFISSDS